MQLTVEKWNEQYQHVMKSWEQNWDVLSSILNFRVIPEKLSISQMRSKALITPIRNVTARVESTISFYTPGYKKMGIPIRGWDKIYGEFAI